MGKRTQLSQGPRRRRVSDSVYKLLLALDLIEGTCLETEEPGGAWEEASRLTRGMERRGHGGGLPAPGCPRQGEEGGRKSPTSHRSTEAAEGRGSREEAIKLLLEGRGCSGAQLLTAD